jgi:hypothetical protein
MINGRFPLPDEHVAAMNQIRAVFQKAADDFLQIADGLEKRDEGRITAVLDQLQAAKNTACDAVILPFGPTVPSGAPGN